MEVLIGCNCAEHKGGANGNIWVGNNEQEQVTDEICDEMGKGETGVE